VSTHLNTRRAIEVLVLAILWSAEGSALAAGKQVPPPVVAITVSLKLDPRLTRSLYMGDRWVSPATYNSLSTQVGKSITVEARAQGIDALGRRRRVNPEWISSDPEMVTVSPPRGSGVTISVRHPGTSSITLKSGETIKKLTLQTVQQGETWRVDIVQEARGHGSTTGQSVRAAAAGRALAATPR